MRELSFKSYMKNWSNVRKSYPGWVVAPYINRRDLESSLRPSEDENKLLQIYEVIRSLQAEWTSENVDDWDGFDSFEEKLSFVETIAWVLEVELHPFYDPLPSLCETLLSSVNPFGEVLDKEKFFSDGAIQKFVKSNSPQLIYSKWVNLALSLLRSYREEYEFEAWQKWNDFLLNQLSDNDDIAFVRHQACLLHLSTWNYLDVQKELECWPEDVKDPYWLTRKAVICGQVGDFKQRRRLFELTLQRIDDLESISSEPFYVSSREIWTRYLYANSVSWQEREQHWDRLYFIGKDQYDPHGELDYFRKQFEPKEEKKISAFDPFSRTSETVSLGGWDDYSKYYKLFRFCDTLAIPPVISADGGIRVLMTEKVRETAAWNLKSADSTRCKWELFTCEDKKNLQRYLTRTNVAMLDQKFVDFWWEKCLKVYDQQSKYQRRQDQNEHQLSLSLEVLSRLALRQEKSVVIELLKRLMLDWNERSFDYFNGVREAYSNLLKRLMQLLEVSDLKPLLVPIFNFPEPSKDNAPYWPRPVQYIPWTGKLERDLEVRSLVSSLLGKCQDRNSKAPLNELIWFLERDCLLENEKVKLANFVWQIPDSPFFPDINFSGLLRLPEIQKGQARDWLVQKFLGTENKRLQAVYSYEKGDESGWGAWFLNVYRVSKLHKAYKNAFIEETLIDWTEAEAVAILDKASNWWKSQKEQVVNQLEKIAFIDRDVEFYIETTVLVLSEVVAPRLTSEKTSQEALMNFRDDLQTTDINTTPLDVALLRFETNAKAKIIGKLQDALFSQDEKEIKGSTEALKVWSSQQGINAMPSMPDDFIFMISMRLASQPHHKLTYMFLEVLVYILENSKGETDLRPVTIALGALREAAKYPAEDGDSEMEDHHQIRWWSVKLATIVAEISNNHEVQASKWLAEAKNDPLPEVRALVTNI